jgi:hypothetical protein
MIAANFLHSQSPSQGGSEEDGTFFDDESLGNRVKHAISQSPRPLLPFQDSSDKIQCADDEEPNGSYPRQNSHQEHQHSPLHHDSSRSAPVSNQRVRGYDDNNAMAIVGLQQDLQQALDDFKLMREQKETSDARALDAQRQNEQLLQRNKRLEEMMQTHQGSQESKKSSPKNPITVTKEGDSEGDADSPLMRDYRAALERIEALQAVLHHTQRQSENEVENQPTNSETTFTENHQGEKQRGTPSASKEHLQQPTEIEQDSDDDSSQPETLRRPIQLQKGKPNFFPKVDTRNMDPRDDAIVDRLSRIRDATDRAALVKDHHREIARLKAQQESKINELIRRNEERLQKCLNATKSLLSAKHKETLEDLQLDFERSMIGMEKRHREEIVKVSVDKDCCLFTKVSSSRLTRLTLLLCASKLREEINKSGLLSGEVLAAAIAKTSSGKQLLMREMAKSGQLKHAIKQLEQQVLHEKIELSDEHAGAVLALKKSYEEDRTALLDTMQTEVNDLFQQKRDGSPTSASKPKPGLVIDGLLAGSTFRQMPHQSKELERKVPIAEGYSGIDRELRETEALVRGLFGDYVDGE